VTKFVKIAENRKALHKQRCKAKNDVIDISTSEDMESKPFEFRMKFRMNFKRVVCFSLKHNCLYNKITSPYTNAPKANETPNKQHPWVLISRFPLASAKLVKLLIKLLILKFKLFSSSLQEVVFSGSVIIKGDV